MNGSKASSAMFGSPRFIQIGKHKIQTWYSSPYPQKYARLKKLYLCEFCLQCFISKATLKGHLTKCGQRCPPIGTEIYRRKDLTVFEVDGNTNKMYSQNLCLLSKLFLGHKTLLDNEDSFFFYVLTKHDRHGYHLVGYFSKVKLYKPKFNVSCMMILPPYQRQGFGRFLIDFSYLLSKQEGRRNSGETFLVLGALVISLILEVLCFRILASFGGIAKYLHRDQQQISQATGMSGHDVETALQLLKFVKSIPDTTGKGLKLAICVDWKFVECHATSIASSKTRIPLDHECLKWTPLSYQLSLSEESMDG